MKPPAKDPAAVRARCAECGMDRAEVLRSTDLMNSESGSGVPIEDPICCETYLAEEEGQRWADEREPRDVRCAW